jgi:hypothetical protein
VAAVVVVEIREHLLWQVVELVEEETATVVVLLVRRTEQPTLVAVVVAKRKVMQALKVLVVLVSWHCVIRHRMTSASVLV